MGNVSSTSIRGSKISIGHPLNEWCEGLNADMINNLHLSPNVVPIINSEGILDLSSTYAKIDTYSFRRVDLTDAIEDYELQIGEEAEIRFENVTSVPLHIATFDGTYYQMDLIPSDPGGNSGGVEAPIYLNPNNTIYSEMFRFSEIWKSSAMFSSAYRTYSAFRLGWAFSSIRCNILNRTIYKNIKGIFDTYRKSTGYPCIDIFSTDWRDTTTPWTSLGTITFPQNTSGEVLVKRLA